jgi:hypothetical protein
MLAALRLGAVARIKLALLSLAIVGAVYSIEVLLVGEETLAKRRMASRHGVAFDVRDRLEVVRDLRRQGVSAVPVIAPHNLLQQDAWGSARSVIRIGNTETLPLGGISGRVTVFCNESGVHTTFTSDEHGFHNPTRTARSVYIAALGDSFTLGGCVASDRNFVSLIRQRYSGTLNLGVNGIGPLIELALLKEYLASSVHPKIVLWCYFEGNDLRNLMTERKSPLLRRYLDAGFTQGLLARQPDIDRALSKYVEDEMEKETARRLQSWLNVIKLIHLRQRLDLLGGRFVKEEPVTADTLELFGRILLQASTRVDSWGGKLVFVYLPDWLRYGDPMLADQNRQPVLALVKALHLPLVDLHEALQVHEDPLSLFPFRRRGHYNEAGHRIVAERVLEFISRTQ